MTEIGRVLRSHIAEQSDGVHTLETIKGDGHLFDEGYLDSLSSVSLVALIEDRYGVRVEEVELVALSLDRDGRVTFCNDRLLQLAGWSRDEIIDCDWFTTFIAKDRRVADRRAY